MAQFLFNNAYTHYIGSTTPLDFIDSTIDNNYPDTAFLIVPTGKLVRHYKMLAVRKYFEKYKKPATEFQFYTLKSLASYCFGKLSLDKKYKTISDAYRLSLFEEAAQKANLNFFAKPGRDLSPVILEKLAELVYGLKEDGITAEHLKNDLENAINDNSRDVEIHKLSDIINLYESYQNLLGEKFLDFPELLNLTIDSIKSSGVEKLENILPEGTKILIYGFSEFKQPEMEFISLFSESTIPCGIRIEYSIKNGPLISILADNVIKLKDAGFNLTSLEEKEEKLPPGQQKFSYFLSRWLFNTDANVINKNLMPYIKIIAADNKNDEVVSIAKLTKYLILKNNIKPYEICIVARQPENYSGLFREIFPLYQIPANITDRFPLSKSSVAIAVFAVLELITRGFRRDDLHRAMLSPFLSFVPGSLKGEKIDGINLFSVAVKLRITGGARRGSTDFWSKRLKGSLESINNKIARLKDKTNTDKAELERTLIDYNNTKKAIDDFNKLLKLIPCENSKISVQEFNEIIKDGIIKRFNIKENILALYEHIKLKSSELSKIEKNFFIEEIEKNGRAFSALIKLLDEFTYILDERFPKKKFRLDELVQRFKTAVSAEKYQVKEKFNYGVSITSIEQTRGLPYKVMILCGALDGEFPIAYKTDIFLGKELPGSETRHNSSERMQFYQFLVNSPDELDNGNKNIFITYPKSYETEMLIKSPFIDSLLKIISHPDEKNIFDLSDLRKEKRKSKEFDSSTLLKVISIDNNFEWLDAISNESELLIARAKKDNQIPEPQLENLIKKSNTFSDNITYIKNLELIDSEEKEIISKKNANTRENDLMVLSVSDLETYASCPYKYFVEKHIKPEELKIEDTSLTPVEKGTIYHDIFYRFYIELKDEQLKAGEGNIFLQAKIESLPPILTVNLKTEEKDRNLNLLKEIAKEELEKNKFSHPFFEMNEEEILGSRNKPGIMETWLNLEIKRKDEGWLFAPALFEFGFGTFSHKSTVVDVEPVKLTDNFALRGKIDRIELLKKDNQIYLMVADYKSGSQNLPTINKIYDGTSFQMPLYLLAAKKILKDYYSINAELAGAVYYLIKPGVKNDNNKIKITGEKFILITEENHLSLKYKNTRTKNSFLDEDDMLFCLDSSVNKAVEISGKIMNEEFPVEPLKSPNPCRYCSYQPVCRINENELLIPTLSETEAE